MFSVRQERWPAMRGVLHSINLGDWLRRSAAGANAHQRRGRTRGKHDHTVRAPGAAAPELGIANYKRRAATQINRLQLSVGEKAEGTAVRRPERKKRIVGSRQGAR